MKTFKSFHIFDQYDHEGDWSLTKIFGVDLTVHNSSFEGTKQLKE